MTSPPRLSRAWCTIGVAVVSSLVLLAGGCGTAGTSRSANFGPGASVSSSAPAAAALISRTPGQLRAALLGLEDVPSDFDTLAPAAVGSASNTGPASSSRPACQALVRLLNSRHYPGSTAAAKVTFAGGEQGPFLDETLDAFGSDSRGRAAVQDYRRAVQGCGDVQLAAGKGLPGTLHARVVGWPHVGDDTLAVRFTGRSGALKGFQVLLVVVQTRDVVAGLTFLDTGRDVADTSVRAAVTKAQQRLRETVNI